MDLWLTIWCGVILLSLVVEVSTFGLISIWFAIGAAVSAVMAAFELPVWSRRDPSICYGKTPLFHENHRDIYTFSFPLHQTYP